MNSIVFVSPRISAELRLKAANLTIRNRSVADVAGARGDIAEGLHTGKVYNKPISRSAYGFQFDDKTFQDRECLTAYILTKFW